MVENNSNTFLDNVSRRNSHENNYHRNSIAEDDMETSVSSTVSTPSMVRNSLFFKRTKSGPVMIEMAESPKSCNVRRRSEIIVHRVLDDNKPNNDTNTDIYRAMDVLDTLSHAKNEESWTDEQEAILNLWAEKAAMYRWLHRQAYEYYALINNIITYPIILLSAILGMSGFAMITNEKPSETEIVIAYVTAGSNFVVALLSSIQKVKQYSENSEKHLTASVEYVKFYREIKLELVIDRGSRAYSIDFCRDIKNKFNKLTSNSPTIPYHLQKKGEHKGIDPPNNPQFSIP